MGIVLLLLALAGAGPAVTTDTLAAKKIASAVAKEAPAAKKVIPAVKKDTLTTANDTIVAKKETAGVKDSAARPAYGRLSITTEPAQAEVMLDSAARGQSPCVLDSVTPGPHVLIIKKKGFFGKKVSIDVPADSMVALPVTLVAPGGLVVTTRPSGARVLLDGKEMGVTPWENAKLRPGTHAFACEKDGFAAYEKQVTVVEGKTDSLSFALEPKPAAPAAAPVKEKGKPVGFDKVTAIVVGCVFVVFAIVLLAVDLQK